MSDYEDWQGAGSNASRSLALVQSALEVSSNLVDEYVQEAMSANCENGYFDYPTPSSPPSDPHFGFDEHDHVSFFTAVDPKAMSTSLSRLCVRGTCQGECVGGCQRSTSCFPGQRV